MKRYLFPQMLHEWRSNIWLVIELLIVAAVVAFLSFMLSIRVRNLLRPLGFNPENVYTLSLNLIDPRSPEQIDLGEDWRARNLEDIRTMLARLRANPHVEAVAISQNATPYSLNYQGNELRIEGFPDSVRYPGNLRMASPDIVRVLQLEPLEGVSSGEMEKRMRLGEVFVSPDNPDYILSGNESELVGKKINMGDTVYYHKVGGLMRGIRRQAYEYDIPTILWPIDEDNLEANDYGYDVILRVRDGEGPAFMEDLRANPSMRRLRNATIEDAAPLSTLKGLTERSNEINLRLYVAMVIFFLIIVYLGLLGTFWYRVQQRSGEIALRKVTGATSSDILRRLLSEGTILLLCSLIPAFAVCFFLFHKFVLPNYDAAHNPTPDLWVAYIVTYILMQLVVIVGILFPALKAMRLEPAIVLKDE